MINMATEMRTIGWIQLIGGLVALWAALTGNLMLGLGALGLVFVTSGYHHLTGHK